MFEDNPMFGVWQNQTIYTFKGPIYENFEHILSASIDRTLHPTIATLETFAVQRTEAIVQGLKGIEVGKSAKLLLGGVFSAHELLLKWTLDRTVHRVMQYFFVIVEERGITFSCTYTEKSFKELKHQVKKIIEAFLTQRRYVF
jgi:hypothetical protein